MAYRSELEALRARWLATEQEISLVRAHASEQLQRRLGPIERELAELGRRIADLGGRVPRRLADAQSIGSGAPGPLSLSIASPCSARWDDMQGDERMRVCGRCCKSVYEVAELDEQELAQLLAHSDAACLRLHRRADGTVITGDCPDGARSKRRRLLLLGTFTTGLLVVPLAIGALAASTTTGVPSRVNRDLDAETRLEIGRLYEELDRTEKALRCERSPLCERVSAAECPVRAAPPERVPARRAP